MMNDVQFFTPRYDTPSNASSISSETIRDETQISHLPFHKVTWLSSHNSHANNFAAGDNTLMRLATNQKYSIYEQLKLVGVRGLMMDIEYNQNGGINLVHGLIEFASLENILNYEIIPFLEEDTNAIITLDFETLGDRELLMQELRIILANTPRFTSRIFRINDDRWANHKEWPTIQAMRDSDQRVIILSDSTIVKSNDLGIMLRNSITMENHWLGGLDKCSPRNEYLEDMDVPWHTRSIWGKTWTRLFTMNHFCCGTGIESLPRVNPNNYGGGDNGWGKMYPRILLCMEANGFNAKPNYLVIDWVDVESEAHEVADYLNFGGRLGTGQQCRSDEDCATDSCNRQHNRCQCKICEPGCTSGCTVDERCIVVQETGRNVCASKTIENILASKSSYAETVRPQSLEWITILLLLMLLISH